MRAADPFRLLLRPVDLEFSNFLFGFLCHDLTGLFGRIYFGFRDKDRIAEYVVVMPVTIYHRGNRALTECFRYGQQVERGGGEGAVKMRLRSPRLIIPELLAASPINTAVATITPAQDGRTRNAQISDAYAEVSEFNLQHSLLARKE